MFNFDIVQTLFVLPGLIVGLTLHEAAHAWTAWRLGDTLARAQGRVSLNPLRHLDPIGFGLIVLLGFGWAKPVYFDERNLKRPNTDPVLIALAGPLSNALLAVLFSAAYVFLLPVLGRDSIAIGLIYFAIRINWTLFVFNLLPIPPLDGSHLVFWWFRHSNPIGYQRLYQYGSWILLGLLLVSTQFPGTLAFLSYAVNSLTAFSRGLFS